jgi:membrane protein required for colicin V production
MQVYDIVMIVVLLGTAAWGFMKGLAWQIASIASLVVSYFVAMGCRGVLAPALPGEPPLNNILAMLILFVVTSLAVWIGFRFISGAIEKVKLKAFDHQIGALFGFIKGVLYCVVITLFATTLLKDRREAIVTSKSGHYISLLLTKVDPLLPEGVQEAIGPYVEEFEDGRVQPATEKTAKSIVDEVFDSTVDTTVDSTRDQLTKKFEGFRDGVRNAFDRSSGDVQSQAEDTVNNARDQLRGRVNDAFDDGEEELEMVDVLPPTRKPARR